MRYTVLSLLVGVSLAACGGGPDHSSPKAVAASLAAAVTAGDPATAVALLPPVAQLEAHFACKGERTLVSRRQRQANDAPKQFAKPKNKGLKVSIGAFDKKGSETSVLKVGDTWKDCTVLKEATLHISKLTLVMDQDGKKEDDGETWPFLQLDGKWYFAKL